MVKLKIYSTPNPNPYCIMHLPYSPNPTPPPTATHPALHSKWMTTKPSYTPAHESTAGKKKLPDTSTSNKNYNGYAKMTICSLMTALPMPRTNAPPLPRATPTTQGVWQLIPPMHKAANQPLGLPNAAAIRPTAWDPSSIGP
jgi:hypothetical protein